MLKGIDISNHQQGFNVKGLTLDFAIFKASGGNSFVDKTFKDFVQQAKAKGILWGFYHFAKDGQASYSGKDEADFFIKQTEGCWGHGLPVLDLEDNGIPNWAAYTKEFVNRIFEKKGVYPVIYTGLKGISELKNTDILKKCKIWFAGYPLGYISYWPAKTGPRCYYDIDDAAKIIMWQFTSNMPVLGYNVDANYCYLTKEEWKKLCGKSSPSTKTLKRGEVAAFIHADMCNDDDNGYSWDPRWGEDGKGVKTISFDGNKYSYDRGSYECGTSVTTAWKAALKGTEWEHSLDKYVYSKNAKEVYLSTGLFEWKPMSFLAEPGDIYLNIENHLAMCQTQYPDVLSEFSWGDKGAYGNKVGDQTGKEASVHAYYDYPWDGILHYNGKADSVAPEPTPEPTPSTDVRWRVKQDGTWQKENFVGTPGKKITALALDIPGWYQVCTIDHGWLPPVRGYDIHDDVNGYAGWQDSPVTAIRCYYETPDPAKGWRYAKYRVSNLNSGYFDWQIDNVVDSAQDGYAGDFHPIDRFEIAIV